MFFPDFSVAVCHSVLASTLVMMEPQDNSQTGTVLATKTKVWPLTMEIENDCSHLTVKPSSPKCPWASRKTSTCTWNEHLLNVFELKCKWGFQWFGWSSTCHSAFLLHGVFFLSAAPPVFACVSQTQTMKINEVAPKAAVTLGNKAPVPLMDHIDNLCGISINRQWNDMK